MARDNVALPRTAEGRSPATTVQRIEDPAGFADLREEWDELLAASSASCLFLTWEWLHTWWKHLGGSRRLYLLLVRDGRELAAIAPLAQRPAMLSRLVPFSALEFLGTGTVGSDYLDVIVRRGREQTVLEVLASALADVRPGLELAQVNRETSFAVKLTRRLEQREWSIRDTAINVCPFVDLAGHSWESYLASLGKAHRKNFLWQLKNLEKRFNVRLELVQNEAERREALALLVALHTRRWQARGGSEAFGSPQLLSFYDEVSRLALQRDWLRLFVLRLDGRPAAVLHGYRYGPTFYFYQSGIDPDFAKESVGKVIAGLTIRYAIEDGAAEYDFLHGAERYKFHWARRDRELGRLELFAPGIRGAVCRYLAVTCGRIRRTARVLVGDALTERLVSRGWVGVRDALSPATGGRHRDGVAGRAQ